MVETDEPAHLAGELEIYPNPGVGMVNFEMKEGVSNAKFTLRDPLGKLILDANFTGNRFQFERGGLSAGVYFFQLVTDKGGEFSGRIIMRD